jgi:hypothetical protein
MDASDLSPQDRDLMIRTMIGEGGDPSSIGHVIWNRVNADGYGHTPTDVVLAPNQFTPWQTRARELMAIDPSSKQYQRAGAIVDNIVSGNDQDPTGGATHFYAPASMQPPGRVPSWASGQTPTAVIGGHRFFAPYGRVASSQGPDLLGAWSTTPGTDASSASPAASSSAEPDLLGAWNAGTSSTTSQAKPLPVLPQEEGGWTYVPGYTPNRWISEHQGDTPMDKAIRLGASGMSGVEDVANTIARGIGWTGEKGANALASAGVISPESAQNVAAWHARINQDIAQGNALTQRTESDSPLAQAGRIGGEILATGPFIPAAPEAILPNTARNFVEARPLLQTALQGATAGGVTTGLTSSISDQPWYDQVLTGAALGGGLGPLGYGIGRSVNALASLSGIDAATAQLADLARTRFGIPVGTGQMSSNPMVRFLDSVLRRAPFSGYGGEVAAQQQAINQAATATMGSTADNIGPAAMAAARAHLSNEFETTLPKLEAHLNPNVRDQIQSVTDATEYLPQEDARVINKLAGDVLNQFTGVPSAAGAASRDRPRRSADRHQREPNSSHDRQGFAA